MRLKGLSILLVGMFCLAIPQIANAAVWKITNPKEGDAFDDNVIIPVAGFGEDGRIAKVKIYRKVVINGETIWSYVTEGQQKVDDIVDAWNIPLSPPGGKWTTAPQFTEYKIELFKLTEEGDESISSVKIKIITTGGPPGGGGT